MLTQERLKELFDYHEDGHLIWKTKSSKKASRIIIGNIAGTLSCVKGLCYWRIHFDDKTHFAHRLIYIWHHGSINKKQIDHIDGNGLNNKILNLREASHSQNMMNQGPNKSSKTGVRGVKFSKAAKKYIASIKVNKVWKHLGTFDNLFTAAIARKKAEQEYFGEYAKKENV